MNKNLPFIIILISFSFSSLNLLSKKPEEKSTIAKPLSFEFWIDIILVILLTLFAGTMSGLTVGYMAIDTINLQIKIENSKNEEEKKKAEKLYNMLSKHHWLLITLLLCNSFAAETMPIILNRILSEVPAIVISVLLLLFFGEILPMALCTGPRKEQLCYFCSNLTYLLMYITYIFSYPISLLMDKIIGKNEEKKLSNNEITQIIKLHSIDNFESKNNNDYGLTEEQINIANNCIESKNNIIGNFSENLGDLEMIEENESLNNNLINKAINNNKNEIIIYNKENDLLNIVGILRINLLIGKNFENKKINELDINLNKPLIINNDDNVYDAFNKLRNNDDNIAFLKNDEKIISFVSYKELINKMIEGKKDDKSTNFNSIINTSENNNENSPLIISE
jgi:metal transporter CNNM